MVIKTGRTSPQNCGKVLYPLPYYHNLKNLSIQITAGMPACPVKRTIFLESVVMFRAFPHNGKTKTIQKTNQSKVVLKMKNCDLGSEFHSINLLTSEINWYIYRAFHQ